MVSTFYRVIEEFITYGDFDRDSLLLQGIDGLNIYGDAFKDDSFKCKLLRGISSRNPRCFGCLIIWSYAGHS
uniref:Peptidylprolyl isomerase n=1 Tax=Physcomitrium patens TaxID=3218 RepID=A0A7I4C9R5_PHYPA